MRQYRPVGLEWSISRTTQVEYRSYRPESAVHDVCSGSQHLSVVPRAADQGCSRVPDDNPSGKLDQSGDCSRRATMRKLLLVGAVVAAPVLFASSGASAWGCDCDASYGYSYGYSAPLVYGTAATTLPLRIQQLLCSRVRIQQLLPSGVWIRQLLRIRQLLPSDVWIRRLLPSGRALLWCADVRLAWRSGRPQSGMGRKTPLVASPTRLRDEQAYQHTGHLGDTSRCPLGFAFSAARREQRFGVVVASPGASWAGVDVEVAATRVELQTAHRRVVVASKPSTAGLFFADAEVGRIAGQVLGAGRATDLGVVTAAAAGGVDLHGTEDGRHLVDDLTQPAVQTGR